MGQTSSNLLTVRLDTIKSQLADPGFANALWDHLRDDEYIRSALVLRDEETGMPIAGDEAMPYFGLTPSKR